MKFKDWAEKKQIEEAMGFVQKLPYQMKNKPVEKPPVKSVSSTSLERKVNEPKDLMKAVDKYVAGVQKVHDDYYKKNYSNLKPPKIEYSKGGRYIKVARVEKTGQGKSVHSFIDTKEGPEFGNIYKPASWKAPAKGSRGNVFSTQNGLEAISIHGGGGVWYAR